jgi:hypothetical protein
MDELLSELRRASDLFSDDGWWKPDVLTKAADTIERLSQERDTRATGWLASLKEVDRLRTALEKIRDTPAYVDEPRDIDRQYNAWGVIQHIAREALRRDALTEIP